MNFHRQQIRSIQEQARTEQCGIRISRLIPASHIRRRKGGERNRSIGWHITAENLGAIQVNDRAIISQYAQEQVSEARISKSETMGKLEAEMCKPKAKTSPGLFSFHFSYSAFGFVSDFDIRISDLDAIWRDRARDTS